jgi:DNA (cytosine-5)-methyltransferase 1
MIRYADLFCGLGAFHQSFKSHSEFKCEFACDIDQKVRKIYETNHGLEPFGDINLIDSNSVPDVDLLCAGFPCQPFSIAGLQMGFDDTNGNLFYEILRFVDAKSPKMVILENVKNLQSHDSGRTFLTIKKSMEDRGYGFSSKVLNAAHYGSPQCRQRIFMVCLKGGGEFHFPETHKEQNTVSSILTESSDSWSDEKYSLVEKKSKSSPFKPKILYDVLLRSTNKGGRQGERIYDSGSCGVTICAQSGGPGAKTGLYKVGDKVRRLNVQECLRMFGFPCDYNFLDASEEQKIFYLGNSIVVNVIDALVPGILEFFKTRAI